MSELLCERCTQPLNPNDAVWLDLNIHTGEYRKEPWPEDQSQGAFAFGKACARKMLNGERAGLRVKTPRSK